MPFGLPLCGKVARVGDHESRPAQDNGNGKHVEVAQAGVAEETVVKADDIAAHHADCDACNVNGEPFHDNGRVQMGIERMVTGRTEHACLAANGEEEKHEIILLMTAHGWQQDQLIVDEQHKEHDKHDTVRPDVEKFVGPQHDADQALFRR